MSRRSPTASGFTLIELLVVIAIIVILAAILFPVFARAQMRGKQAACLSNLKQLSTGMLMYAQDNHSRFPARQPAFYFGLYAMGKSDKLFLCPSDAYARRCKDPDFGDFISSYGMNGHLFTDQGAGIVADTLPNPSEIPLMADITRDGSDWLFDSGDSGSIDRRHSGGSNMSFCDGHARMLRNEQINVLSYDPNAT